MIKAAVIGFGFMGRTHAMNILKNKDLDLKAIADTNRELFTKDNNQITGNIQTGNLNSNQTDNINKYSGLDECLSSEDLDAVFICVHTGLHYEMTMKALEAGKNVFLEKPFCLDVLQAGEMITMAKQKGKILMVGHVVRFMQPYNILKQWVDSGNFGELEFLHLTRFCGLPRWGEWKEKKVTDNSGGALFDLLVHDIDYANYVLGIPEEIKCSYFPGRMSKYDYINALWSYKNNLKVRVEGGNTFHSNFPFQAGYMAKFEKASILYNSMKGNIIQVADDTGISEMPLDETADGYYDETAYFADCLKANKPTERCLPESSLESIKLCYKHI
jgi:predicted dehydrogenase